LHGGGERSHHGKFFEVHDARVYNLPSEPVPIYVAAAGPQAAKLAARIGDGLICAAPSQEAVAAFEAVGGAGKPRYAQMTVCWAKTEDEGVRTALEYWPNGGLSGQFKTELPRPANLEEAAQLVTPEVIKKEVVCGPDPQRHIEELRKFARAGFDHVYIHQVGPDQEGFMRFCEREILPNAGALAA
ncbi:MAG TPA: LLM class flavin-dependent oxidoreductase, partial [Candidatus Dormibacteraeota bacterium]|nr:LLM class flavin-dependent oxidoreductase [Candidatus Dormibacteraeota bacterium]